MQIKRNTCQFTSVNICGCYFAFRFNLNGAGRWQASGLTQCNPSSSHSAQSQSTGTNKQGQKKIRQENRFKHLGLLRECSQSAMS